MSVTEFLGHLPNESVFYCPNPGNAGDSLIASSTYRLFQRMGIKYRIVRWDEAFDSDGETVLYGGGGNLTREYFNARRFIERHHRQARQLILLPHTIQGHEDLLQALGENVDLFCREPRSYEWATDKAERANVHLAEDLVFGLDVESVLDEEQGVLALLSEIGSTLYGSLNTRYFGLDSRHHALPLRVALNQGRKAGWQLSTSLSRGGALNALREDRERTEGSVPPSNVDLSQVFAYGTDSPTVAGQATRALLSYLNKFDHITTNRLHLCIPGALLGKQVDFYANSYFKNRAVYEHSIRGRFPNVRWCGSWTSPD